MKLFSILVAATSLGAATATAASNNNFRGSGKSNYSRQLEYDATSTTDQSTSLSAGQTLMYLLANFVMMPMDLSGHGCPKPHPPPKKKSGGSSGGHSSWGSSGGYKWNDNGRSLYENDWNNGGGSSSWSNYSSSGSSSKTKPPPPPRCEVHHAPAPKKKSSSKSHSSGWSDDGYGWDNDGHSYSSHNEYHGDNKESWGFVSASLLAVGAIGAAGFAAKKRCKGGGMFPSQGNDKPAVDDSMDNETVNTDVYEPSPSSYVEMTDPSTQQLRVSIPPPPPAQSSKFGNLSKKLRSITIMKK